MCNMKIKYFNKLTKDAKNIRETVFIFEQGFKSEYDELDDTAIHFVMYDSDNTAIATCRIFEADKPKSYILGRLAVLKEYRGKKYGQNMIAVAEKYVLEHGGKSIKLHAQCHATDFYKKLGYSEQGDIEYEQGCPHKWMIKEF